MLASHRSLGRCVRSLVVTWEDTVESELRKCTDCGLCLSSCPTFAVTRAEGDSPRGRVHLLDLALGGAQPDETWANHLAGWGCPVLTDT
ncbi:(Fe-S)-binding protein [Amycolatopsis benzoatilytica]|uniref:4Fe-4S dicluster domain-containing protein n=1 Tax=Amycolatopsis benzoatilytica TaxID=346045 RepID=UPI0012B68DF9